MRRRSQPKPARKQPTPQELLDQILDFLQRKFYEGHPVSFAKDRPRLLDWVVLWPAKWLDDRGVTIPADRYRDIFFTVFLDALACGNTGNITYLPAYLAKVIQSHFAMHGDEYYAEAKSMRTLVENSIVLAGRLAKPEADPVSDLARVAQASRLLRPKKKAPKAPVKAQLTLL
jgi:hypothetical protein